MIEILKESIKKIKAQKFLYPLITLIIIFSVNTILIEDFLKIIIKDGHFFGSIIDILNRSAPVMLLTIGVTLVYTTKGMDLSVGAIMAISGAIAASIIRPGFSKGIIEYNAPPAPIFIVIFIPLIVSALAGAWNGIFVSYLKIQPIIATLILMIAGRGISQLITNGQIIIFNHSSFEFIGSGFFLGLPFPFIIVISLLIIVYLATRKTRLGLYLEVVGNNPKASYLLGINPKFIKFLVYIISGICAGIAGLIVTADIKGADGNNCGLYLEFDAIASVIIGGSVWGGKFTLFGSILGTLIIQSITTTILTLGIPSEHTPVYKALIVIFVASLQLENLVNIFIKNRKK